MTAGGDKQEDGQDCAEHLVVDEVGGCSDAADSGVKTGWIWR